MVGRHAGPVAEFKAGKEGAFNFLVGQVMRATKGKANPKLVNELLKKILQGDEAIGSPKGCHRQPAIGSQDVFLR